MSSAAISVACQSSWVGALGPRSAVSYIRDSTPVALMLLMCRSESLSNAQVRPSFSWPTVLRWPQPSKRLRPGQLSFSANRAPRSRY